MRTFGDKFDQHDRQWVDDVVETLINFLHKLERAVTATRPEDKTIHFSKSERGYIYKLAKKGMALKNKLHGIVRDMKVLPDEEIADTPTPDTQYAKGEEQSETKTDLDSQPEPLAETTQMKELVLHCEVCSLLDEQGNYRLHPDSAIGIIDENLLRLPLRWEMFKSMNTKRGVPSFWRQDVTWEGLKCPHAPQGEGQGHSPWKLVDEKATQERMRQGGPSRLLTNRGWILINERGIVVEPVDQAAPLDEEVWKCEVCGREFKTKANLGAHMRSHKKK